MTKRAAILFELPGSCDYWKDERLHEVVHDGTSHEFDGCRYGLKQRYAKKPMPIKKPWSVVSWNFELGGSLSKKCNGNHEHGPCAGRETKETQLYTSIIVGVILRRFRARARCLKPAPLKLALACITRGRSRKHQATASEICTAPTAQPRCWVSPEPLGAYGELGQSRTPSFKEELDEIVTSIRGWDSIGTIPWLHLQLLIVGFPGSGEYHQDGCQCHEGTGCRQYE